MTPSAEIVGRFAPSPTGHLHLGSMRTALLAWCFARHKRGKIYYRIEDIDFTRARNEFVERQMQDLTKLGLVFDEFRSQPSMRQSQELLRYRDCLIAIDGRTFACVCSRKKLESLRPSGPSEDYYPGFCRTLGLPKDLGAVRFDPPPKQYSIDDLILGERFFNTAQENGPFIVKRADGPYSYQLAVVSDDIEMEVTQVIRGADILSSTGMQLSLFEALGYPAPRYGHVPLVLSVTGRKFSKSEGAVDLMGLEQRGVTTPDLLGFFAHSSGLADHATSIHDVNRVLAGFDPKRVIQDETRVDMANLQYYIGGSGPFELRQSDK